MDVNIKKTTNIALIVALASTLKDYFNPEGLKSIERDAKISICFGAYDGDKMVGFIIYKEVSKEAIELEWMGVLAEFQSKGIGSKLVEVSLREVGGRYKACEVKTLSDTVDYGPYEKTRRFYQRLGFIALETINPYPGWTDPCQIFVKFLQPS